jgi:hypothetical protein
MTAMGICGILASVVGSIPASRGGLNARALTDMQREFMKIDRARQKLPIGGHCTAGTAVGARSRWPAGAMDVSVSYGRYTLALKHELALRPPIEWAPLTR